MYRVLFVDDDEAIGFLVARYRIWKTAGFELADFAYNGREALEKLSAGGFDLIITDIRMPVMNGLDLLRRIREKGYPAIVILASTYQDFTYAKEGIRLGAVEYLEKPYSEEKVAEALRLAEDYLGQEREDAPERYWHALLEGEDPAQLADSLFREAQDRYPQDGERMRRDVAGLLEKVYQKMCEQAPWLKVIDKKDFIIGGRPAEEAEEIFKELQWKIKQYGLRSPDLMAVRIARLIEEYLVSDHLQDILAEKLELSKDYIAKLFRGRSGMTISEYTTLLKMEKAKELLRTTMIRFMKSGKLWDTALQIILPDFLKAVSDVRPLIFVNTVLRKKNSDSPGPCTATGKTARGRQGQKQKRICHGFFRICQVSFSLLFRYSVYRS